jgi:hypothetical protein
VLGLVGVRPSTGKGLIATPLFMGSISHEKKRRGTEKMVKATRTVELKMQKGRQLRKRWKGMACAYAACFDHHT